MNVNVVSLFNKDLRARDWTNQELAEFYRVESSLIRAGLSVETDHGLSDEGDPWFVFCHAETGDVIIHFARLDGSYVVAGAAFDRCMRGADFRSLIEAMIETHPLTITKSDGAARISIHPAALLVAVVMTCFFKLAPTKAYAGQVSIADAHTDLAAGADHDDAAANSGGVTVDERNSKMVLAAIAFAVTWEDSGAAADRPSLAGPPIADVAEPVAFSSHSEHTDAWLIPLDDSGFALNHPGQSSEHAQPAVGVLSFSEAAAARELTQIHATLQTPSVLTFDADHFDKASLSSFHVSDAANAAPHSADQGVGNLVWLPTIVNGALAEKGWITASSSPATAANQQESMQEVANVLGGNQPSSHQVQDLSGAQPQFVVNLVEHSVAPPATQPATTASSNPAAALSGSGSTSVTTDVATAHHAPIVSTYDIHSQAGVTAFDHALEGFTAAHPDYQLVTLPKDLVIYDSHLTASNASHANVLNWVFPDGSQVTLVGVEPQHAPLLG